MIIELNEDNFNDTIQNGLTLVDFWANDCNPCKQMSDILDNFNKTANKDLKIGKLNGDNNISVVQKYRIMSAPTLIVFKDGNPVEQLIGVQTKEKLEEITNKYL